MRQAPAAYPRWKFYPSRSAPPPWVPKVVEVFSSVQAQIDSITHQGISSDTALLALRPGLIELGFNIERSKAKADKLSRPVLYGELGLPQVSYEVDGFHSAYGIVLEVEAGRGAVNNADYRDLIRASLIADAEYLILAMMVRYSGGGTPVESYERTRSWLDAVYASDRLKLPLKGILLVGY